MLNASGQILADAAECVGTVDSFQGGERDLIIFGFTRSNSTGDIGFLREVRRLNVAMTRARRQLVLVGDLDSLTRTKNSEFRAVMTALRTHLGDAGVELGSLETEKILQAKRSRREW
jgi:superfamily I DNA and/or RNA helicase